MSIVLASSDLLKVLDPAAASTRASFSQRRRPWSPGYGLKATAVGTTIVYGVNHPGTLAAVTVRIVVQGAGTAATTSPATYTVPTSTVTLPTDTSLTVGSTYANAIAVLYTQGNPQGTLLPRVATSGGNPSSGAFWRCDSATVFAIATAKVASNFTDMTTDQYVEIIIPSTTATTVWDVATGVEGTIPAYDFLIAGSTSKAGIAYLNRIFV